MVGLELLLLLALEEAERLGVHLALLLPVLRLRLALLARLARDAVEKGQVLVVEVLVVLVDGVAVAVVRRLARQALLHVQVHVARLRGVVLHVERVHALLLDEHVLLVVVERQRLRRVQRRVLLLGVTLLRCWLATGGGRDLELVGELLLDLLLEAGVRLLEVELALELERLGGGGGAAWRWRLLAGGGRGAVGRGWRWSAGRCLTRRVARSCGQKKKQNG